VAERLHHRQSRTAPALNPQAINNSGTCFHWTDQQEEYRMFHKAVELTLLDGTAMEVQFQDGRIKRYDLSDLFDKYPQLQALKDRSLFLQGRLEGAYGIVWNDDLDLETETVYEEGITVRTVKPAANLKAAQAVAAARAEKGLSQKQLAELTGIDQSDISKIERGLSNPSVSTMERIARALGGDLLINISFPSVS
jgi:DNA-binding XRE family transcriptional regulator